ncbi:MAG: helix-turn-helix domain-containing protein [Clostridia bacterium]|nr:helix-turn-helix domain-containing protein [Clostridia bacterium]
MKAEIIIDKINATDMIPIFIGCESCESGHTYGPHIRSHYIIHYCLSGKGTLFDKFGEHKISAGELFIIREGELTTYSADGDDPWEYVWIAFMGERASVFSTDRSVYSCSSEPFLRILELAEAAETSSDIYVSIIYDIIYRLFSKREHSSDTLSSIRKYIRYNYMMDISAESVASSFGYERTYLYRIFKKRYGTGIKEYIIKIRMDNARAFLLEGRSVAETAALTGYKDEFNFSRAYKKHFGIPPSKTRGMPKE